MGLSRMKSLLKVLKQLQQVPGSHRILRDFKEAMLFILVKQLTRTGTVNKLRDIDELYGIDIKYV